MPSTQSRVGIPLMFSVRALAHVYRNSRARHTLSGMNTTSKPPPIIMHSAMVTTPTHLLNNAVDRMRRTTPPPVSNKNCHTPPVSKQMFHLQREELLETQSTTWDSFEWLHRPVFPMPGTKQEPGVMGMRHHMVRGQAELGTWRPQS